MKELYPGDQGIWVQYLQLALQRAGQQVMLDFDLAALYQVETKVLKQAVRRNIERFPEDFIFEISNEEYNSLKISLRSQIVILKMNINMTDITEKTENGELVTNRDQLVVVDNIESLIKVIRGQQRYEREYSNVVEKPNTLYHPQWY